MQVETVRRFAGSLALIVLASFAGGSALRAQEAQPAESTAAADTGTPGDAADDETADQAAQADTAPTDPDSVDWSVLNDPTPALRPSIVVHPARSAAAADTDPNWKRNVAGDGSSTLSFNRKLPITWD